MGVAGERGGLRKAVNSRLQNLQKKKKFQSLCGRLEMCGQLNSVFTNELVMFFY